MVQKKVSKSNRRMGKKYRKTQKLRRLKRAARRKFNKSR